MAHGLGVRARARVAIWWFCLRVFWAKTRGAILAALGLPGEW